MRNGSEAARWTSTQYRDPELVNRPVLEFLDRHYPAPSR